MTAINSVCIYCGSSNGADEKYKIIAREAGEYCAAQKWKIVYGGGHNGLMGAMADAALKKSAHVTGVIPHHLKEQEAAHMGLGALHVTHTMHERQLRMSELSDAFVILPGGLGTLAEFFEIVTWKQLRLHQKPIVIVNAYGFWDPLLAMIGRIEEEKFLYRAYADLFTVVEKTNEIAGAFLTEDVDKHT
jgi:uncharacterized protein (TIGR00730 family)